MRRSVWQWIIGAMLLVSGMGAFAGEDTAAMPGYGPGSMMGPGMMGQGMMGGYGQYGMGPHMMCQGDVPGMGPGMMRGPEYGMHGDRGYGMGGGMMRGDGGYGMWMHGMWGGMGRGMMGGYGMLHGLNLTDEQREKIMHLMDARQKAMWKAVGDMMDARITLRDLYAEDQPDPGKVGAAYAQISRVRQKMVESQVRTHNEIWNLLTKEQRDELHKWRSGGWRHGPREKGGPSPGMMRK